MSSIQVWYISLRNTIPRQERMNTQTVKVFVSHSSEDKERFVIDFAKKLLTNGVDAWVDQWEILPGDSLIDKLFEEGIKAANAVIIVISKSSVLKPWVKAELNTSIVNRLQRGTKIIPLVIDDVEVPECLQSTVWVKIRNINSYETEFRTIIAAIYDHRTKPAIGQPPKFISDKVHNLPGLTQLDSSFFKLIYSILVDTHDILNKDLVNQAQEMGLSESDLNESIAILENLNLINVTRYIFGEYSVRQTKTGAFKYYERYKEGFSDVFTKIISLIVNENIRKSEELYEKTAFDPKVVYAIASFLEDKKLLEMGGFSSFGGRQNFELRSISPLLKRTYLD